MNNKFILIGAISVLVVALVAGLVVVGIGEMSLKDPESTSASQESTLAESTATAESSTAGETTDATQDSTAGTTENETTATEETVPGESTQGGNSGTKPTKPDNSGGGDGFDEHKPGSTEDTTKPTKKPEPTDPPKPPVIEEGKNPTFNGKTLDEFTYVDYVNMEVTVEQPAFITWATEQLGSRQAFKQWYLKVQKEYNDSQTTVVIGGGNSIDLGDLINQQNKK